MRPHVRRWLAGGSVSISMRWTQIPPCSCSLETLGCCWAWVCACILSSCNIHPPVISRKSSCVVSPPTPTYLDTWSRGLWGHSVLESFGCSEGHHCQIKMAQLFARVCACFWVFPFVTAHRAFVAQNVLRRKRMKMNGFIKTTWKTHPVQNTMVQKVRPCLPTTCTIRFQR